MQTSEAKLICFIQLIGTLCLDERLEFFSIAQPRKLPDVHPCECCVCFGLRPPLFAILVY